MAYFLVQEEYKEYIVGSRLVVVEADSEEDVYDGDYEFYDVVDEIDADGEIQETNLILDTGFLKLNWKEPVIESNSAGVPLAQLKQWEEE